MRVSVFVALFQISVTASVLSNPDNVPFRVLLGVRSFDYPRANEDFVNFRIALVGCRSQQTSVVTQFGDIPQVLSRDGAKLTLLFVVYDASLEHNGRSFRVDTPITNLALANVDDKTVAYLNNGAEIQVNLAKMPNLKTIEVGYSVGCGTVLSPFWRGKVVTAFDVKRHKDGYYVFGDGKTLGTCEGTITATKSPDEMVIIGPQANSPQPTTGGISPPGEVDLPDNSGSAPLHPPEVPPPAKP